MTDLHSRGETPQPAQGSIIASSDHVTTDQNHESPLQAISNGMAQLYKRQYGRGPTKVKTFFAGPDTIVCILEDTQTPAEHKLVELGEFQRLRDIRLFFQYAVEDDFKQIIEEAIGRRVRAFVSGVDALHDACAEVFLLEDEAPTEPATAPQAH